MTEGRRTDVGPALARRREARRERARGRRRRGLAWSGGVLALLLVFFLGIALGRALESAPRPGGTRTSVKTFEPGTIPPVTRTVTVTSQTP